MILKRSPFASTNAADFAPDDLVNSVNRAIGNAGRKVVQSQYVAQADLARGVYVPPNLTVRP